MVEERQELHCHNCGRYVQFNLDPEQDGNYVLDCPNCDHKHYRRIINGRITDERWGQGPLVWTAITNNLTSSASSTFTTYTGTVSGSATTGFLYDSWMNTTTGA